MVDLQVGIKRLAETEQQTRRIQHQTSKIKHQTSNIKEWNEQGISRQRRQEQLIIKKNNLPLPTFSSTYSLRIEAFYDLWVLRCNRRNQPVWPFPCPTQMHMQFVQLQLNPF